jgi:hypothetical protein
MNVCLEVESWLCRGPQVESRVSFVELSFVNFHHLSHKS